MSFTKKLKVVWFCGFTNSFVQEKIKPWRKVGEIAPWISSLISIFEENEHIELHVISQHQWIASYKFFENKGIYYHFYPRGIPLIGKHWPNFLRLDFWTGYYKTKRWMKTLIKKINPDIIHMHGVENEFCEAIYQFHNKYPVFITIQGFISKSTLNTRIINNNKRRELELLQLFQNFGYRTETMGREIKDFNSKANLFWHGYPVKIVDTLNKEKKFDIVFFGRVTKDKGIIDLLEAVSVLSKEISSIKLCVIGGGNLELFKKIAQRLEIEDSVFWTGFLPSQNDVFDLVAQSKLCVLPTYHDIISGTIIESLFLELPVIAYNVGSIHEVNKNENIISLVEKGNIKLLTESIRELLSDEKMRTIKGKKGRKRAIEMFEEDNKNIINDLLLAYNSIIKEFIK